MSNYAIGLGGTAGFWVVASPFGTSQKTLNATKYIEIKNSAAAKQNINKFMLPDTNDDFPTITPTLFIIRACKILQGAEESATIIAC